MQAGAFIRAVQMLGVDIGNVTTNLALTKGQLEHAQEVAREINVASWVMPGPGVSQPVEQSVFVPIGQYQAVMQLLDALS
jgi:hypothetical protein